MRILSATILAALLFGGPADASAQVLEIRPKLVDSSEEVEQKLRDNAGHASTTIEGNGSHLLVQYFASSPVEFFMTPLKQDGSYVPTDFITFTLPLTDDGETKIDLTVSPGWKPSTQTWLVNLLSKDEKTEAGFTSLTFVPASFGSVVSALVSHVTIAEPYSPSSFHALRGMRVLGTSFTILFGSLLSIFAIVVYIAARKNRVGAVLLVILIFVACSHIRFGVDLLRMTREHLYGYPEGAYDEAGSIYQVAAAVQSVATEGVSVYVCRDGTNFKEKLLRYFVYPVPVRSEDEAANNATLALVMDRFDWELTTETTEERSMQRLRCGALERPARLLSRFPDGSVLFSLTQ